MNTLTATPTERITLYYREGSSDKVYQAAIEPAGERFVVNFAFGRRGSTMNTGTKTNVPVDYAAAKRTFDKLVREKSAKGYTPGADGAPYQQTTNANRGTGRSRCANPPAKQPIFRPGRHQAARRNRPSIPPATFMSFPMG